MIKKILFFSLLTVIGATSSAQEWLGIANSNYAGVTGLYLNPSSIVGSRLKWDIQLIGADIFVQNNYVYIPGLYSAKSTSDTVSSTYSYLKDYSSPNPLKNVYVQLALKLPSVMFRVRRHTFAVTTGYRTAISVNDLDYKLAKFMYEERHLGYTPFQNNMISSNGFKIAGMAWAEIGLTYGYPIINKEKHFLSGAITIKRNFANAGIYMQSSQFQYMITNNASGNQNMAIYNADVEYGHGLYSSDNIFSGGGFGYDIGFTYQKKKKPSGFVGYFKRGKVEKYKYKVGLSVIDIGSITFSENARNSHVVAPANSTITWADVNKTSLKDLEVFDNNVGTNINSNPLGAFAGNSFDIGLPTAVSSQFDVNLNDRFYLNATAVQSTPIMSPSVVRPSQVGVALRYETKYFEVGVPYSLYNYTDHRVGVAFRFGPLILGTDKLGSFLGLNDFTGMDFYFAIKISRYLENGDTHDPNRCFYKRFFRKFQRKKSAPRNPVMKF